MGGAPALHVFRALTSPGNNMQIGGRTQNSLHLEEFPSDSASAVVRVAQWPPKFYPPHLLLPPGQAEHAALTAYANTFSPCNVFTVDLEKNEIYMPR